MNKWFALSRTFWGVIVMLVPVIANTAGWDLGGFDLEALKVNVDQIIVAVGAILTLFGRQKAIGKLTLVPKKGGGNA